MKKLITIFAILICIFSTSISIADTEDVKTIFDEIEKVETDNIYLITWIHTFAYMKKYIKKEGK